MPNSSIQQMLFELQFTVQQPLTAFLNNSRTEQPSICTTKPNE
ncbi:unnamed protein product, partial [Rotaria magnacalcarata]